MPYFIVWILDRLVWFFDLTIEVFNETTKWAWELLGAVAFIRAVYVIFPSFSMATVNLIFVRGWPFVLPVVLLYLLWHVWFWYKQSDYIDKNFLDRITLE